MWWAILWAFVFGGATNDGWAAAFGFFLSLFIQDYNKLEKVNNILQNRNISLQDEIDTSQQKKKPTNPEDFDYYNR